MLRLVKIIYKNSNIYDLITIGPYAKKIIRNIAINSPLPISMLSIWTQNTIMQPSLIPITQSTIKIQPNNSQFCHMEIGVAVREINPSLSEVILQNGNKYKYRQLVYSGDPQQWKQYPIITSENKKPGNVYNDYDYENIQQLFKIKYGSVVFTIPKDHHFGYENYFMILLKSRMENNRKNQVDQKIQITVLCEGQKLFPFNQQLNTLMQKLLKQNDIKLLKGLSYRVDFDKRIVTPDSNSHTPIKYDHLFQYLPLKTPKILERSKINPFENNRQTLSLSKYPNIYILGNVYNNTYNINSMNEMSKIIAKNVFYRAIGVRKKAIFQDRQSVITIWTNDRQCYRAVIDYDQKKAKKKYWKHKAMRYWHGFVSKLLTKQQVYTLVNNQYLGNQKMRIQKQSQNISLKVNQN